jgi:two-component system cell cycle sensor histidine kinase/response regulator CckA
MQPEKVIGKRILLADDQQGVREAVKFLLMVDNHTVVEARNGREALELFSQDRFDLVITDYAMPEMAGNELAVRIKRLVPGQPILMITAYAAELGQSDNPVDAMLNKPFSFDELRQALVRLLGTQCVL